MILTGPDQHRLALTCQVDSCISFTVQIKAESDLDASRPAPLAPVWLKTCLLTALPPVGTWRHKLRHPGLSFAVTPWLALHKAFFIPLVVGHRRERTPVRTIN